MDEPVPLLRFLVGVVRAGAALLAAAEAVAREALPDPIDERPRILQA